MSIDFQRCVIVGKLEAMQIQAKVTVIKVHDSQVCLRLDLVPTQIVDSLEPPRKQTSS